MLKFEVGKKRGGKKSLIITSICVEFALLVLTEWRKISMDAAIDLIDEFMQKFFKDSPFMDYVLCDERFIARRAVREVDRAIAEYEHLTGDDGDVKIEPVYSEKESDGSEAQNLLGGEMRLRAPWLDNNKGI